LCANRSKSNLCADAMRRKAGVQCYSTPNIVSSHSNCGQVDEFFVRNNSNGHAISLGVFLDLLANEPCCLNQI